MRTGKFFLLSNEVLLPNLIFVKMEYKNGGELAFYKKLTV